MAYKYVVYVFVCDLFVYIKS